MVVDLIGSLISRLMKSAWGSGVGKVLCLGLPILGVLLYVVFRGRPSIKDQNARQRIEAIESKRRVDTDVAHRVRKSPDELTDLLSGKGYRTR